MSIDFLCYATHFVAGAAPLKKGKSIAKVVEPTAEEKEAAGTINHVTQNCAIYRHITNLLY